MTGRIALVLAAFLSGCMVVGRSGGDDDDAVPGGGGGPGAPGGGDPGGPVPPESSSSSCDGSLGPEIPEGFPRLGPGCRSRFLYHWENGLFDSAGDEDQAGPRGIRRFRDDVSLAKYDVGLDWGDGFQIVFLYLPSLEPGVYRDQDGAFAGHSITSTYSTLFPDTDGALIVVEGRTDQVVWGRFVAHMCWDEDIDDCYTFEAGRFSAAIDAEPSDYEFGFPPQGERAPGRTVCEVSDDCDLPACMVGTCDGYRCTGVDVQGACPADQYCDWYAGCTAW